MTHLEILKKFKNLNPFELGCCCISFCFILLLFFLDYRSVGSGFRARGLGVWFGPSKFRNSGHERVGFLEMGRVEKCDIFDGSWVWDESYPLYEAKDCLLLDGGFRCSENGRDDKFYTKWRWQPKDCNLPRFDAKTMLERLRNRRLAFVGDSIGRNQWESLLCMLSTAVANKSSVYEVNGRPITKHSGFLVFKFSDFNCTIEYYRAPFLVLQRRPPPGSPKQVRTTLKLDKMDWDAGKWKGADVVVLNSGHWWNSEKTTRAGGDWKSGGSCHLETLPDLSSSPVSPATMFYTNIISSVLSKHGNMSISQPKFKLLNVTYMSSKRKDGHASVYYTGPKPAPLHRQDCSHWCLPGVPDSWNELLYTVFLKREYSRTGSSPATTAVSRPPA